MPWSEARRTMHIPIGVYSITSAMFMPIFQSLVYRKACLDLAEQTGVTECEDESSQELAKHSLIQAEANYIMLMSSSAMCIGAIMSSLFLGRLGDRHSHRLALSIPLLGLIASDLLLLLQWTQYQSSTFLLVLSEAIFGACGGYVSIFSSAFAYVSLKFAGDDKGRSVSIARLEGTIGLGSVIGLMITSRLGAVSYFPLFIFCLACHSLCILMVIAMRDPAEGKRMPRETKQHPWKDSLHFLFKSHSLNRPLIVLLISFCLCFFAFIGTAHILFFYLKHRFTMTVETFSLYRASEKALSTATALLLFPFLRSRLGIRNTSLALLGLVTRSLSKAWHALAWTQPILFTGLAFEAFSRFAASGLRSLMAAQVKSSEQGRLFSLVGLLEAFCNLLAVLFFHSVFPWSLTFMSQLCFLLMSVILIPPIIAIWYFREEIERRGADNEGPSEISESAPAVAE